MKIILGSKKQMMNIRPDGKGTKPVETECIIHYFMESDEREITIVSAREILPSDKEGRGSYEYNGNMYVKCEEQYFGKINHAIAHFLQHMIEGMELKCEVAVLDKIMLIFDGLSKSKDFGEFVKDFEKVKGK